MLSRIDGNIAHQTNHTASEPPDDERAAGQEYSEAEVEKRNPHAKKTYKPRISTRIKWRLEDAMERSVAVQKYMRSIHEWMTQTHKFDIDDRARAHLGKLEHDLLGMMVEVAELERILTAAIAESKSPDGKKQA